MRFFGQKLFSSKTRSIPFAGALVSSILILSPLRAQTPTPPIPAPGQALSLADAEALAIRLHPRISGARFLTQAAGEVTRETRSVYYPQLSGSATAVGTIDNSRIGAGFLNAGNLLNRVAAGVTFQQLISDFGRTKHLVEASRLHEQSRAQDENVTKAQILLDVDRAYFRALRAQALIRVAQETVSARQVVSDQVAALAQSNLKSQLDVTFANVNLADAKLLLASAQNEVQESFADLSNTLGLPAPQTFQLMEASLANAPDPDSSALIQQAMRERPDLAVLRFDWDSLQQAVEAERALNRPTVSAAAVGGGVPAHDDKMSGRYGAAGINVNIPIFNGSLFKARQTEAVYRAQAAEQVLRDAENRVSKDVQVAWLSSNTAYQRIQLTEQLLAQANQALDLAQSRYDLGLSSIVELSQAQLNKTNAEIQNLTSKYDFQSQTALLRYQMGILR